MAIPPLRQSTIEKMACAHSYVLQEIQGIKMPTSAPADRGNEIHHVASMYTRHCVKRRVPADWAEFDRLAAAAGDEAGQILNGVRDVYLVDFENVAETEWKFQLDEDFNPCSQSGKRCVYEGTLDILSLFGERAGIDDWKSHPRPFDPPTPQSDLYALAVFQYAREVQEVEFTYRFVRYGRCQRSMTYTRDDMNKMVDRMIRYRRHQEAIHADPDAAPALPGAHCCYCPAMVSHTCPIPEKLNPYTALEPRERVILAEFYRQGNAHNNQVLKDMAQSGRELTFADGKGSIHSYETRSSEGLEFPLLKTVPLLLDYADASPEDRTWLEKLTISATKLKSYLGAKKRAMIDQRIRDEAAKPVTRTRTGLFTTDPNEPEEEIGFNPYD